MAPDSWRIIFDWELVLSILAFYSRVHRVQYTAFWNFQSKHFLRSAHPYLHAYSIGGRNRRANVQNLISRHTVRSISQLDASVVVPPYGRCLAQTAHSGFVESNQNLALLPIARKDSILVSHCHAGDEWGEHRTVQFVGDGGWMMREERGRHAICIARGIGLTTRANPASLPSFP